MKPFLKRRAPQEPQEPQEEDSTEQDSRQNEKAQDEEAAVPPPLARSQGRQLSRVGAVAIAGIATSSLDTSTPSRDIAELDEDDEVPPMTNLNRDVSITATVVSEDEYQADIRRAILRNTVRPSKVELSADQGEPKRTKCFWIAILTAVAFFVSILSVLLYFLVPGNKDSQPLDVSGDGVPREENEIRDFLKSRSFDEGESLRQYASPQRIALRFIATELPEADLNEKLVDIYAVTTFFFSTGGTFWNNNTKWKSGDPVCIWQGVVCDKNGYVISIALVDNNLGGMIPPEIGLLSPRKEVDGTDIPGLQQLNLSNNNIRGSIPEQVCFLTSMQDIHVDQNALTGSIPASISQLTSLETASFADNNMLVGRVPAELCDAQITVDCSNVQCECCEPSCSSIG